MRGLVVAPKNKHNGTHRHSWLLIGGCLLLCAWKPTRLAAAAAAFQPVGRRRRRRPVEQQQQQQRSSGLPTSSSSSFLAVGCWSRTEWYFRTNNKNVYSMLNNKKKKWVYSGADGPTQWPWAHRMIAPQQLGTFEPLQYNVNDTTTTTTTTTTAGAGLLLEDPLPGSHRRVRLWDFTSRSGATTTTTNPTNNNNNAAPSTAPPPAVEFNVGWDLQKQLLRGHLDRLQTQQQQQPVDGRPPPLIPSSSSSSFWNPDTVPEDPIGVDTVIFLEHEPIYTLGTGSDPAFIKQQQQQQSQGSASPPVVRMDRGGEVTYHGPGQLVIYPVLDLRQYRQDIHWYVRALEEVVLQALHHALELPDATRLANVTGVWMHSVKVAALGVSCKKWITQHGVAINVTPDCLPQFDGIVPCGLVGRRVGCVNQFLPPERQVTVAQMAAHVQSAMQEIFQIQFVSAPTPLLPMPLSTTTSENTL